MGQKKNLLLRIIVAALVCVFIYCGYNLIVQVKVYGGSNAETSKPVQFADDDDLSTVATKCLDACVSVYYQSTDGDYSLSGSGVAVNVHGYIATNYHVVKGNITNPTQKSVAIKAKKDGEYYPCELLWYNEMCDVAILKTEEDNVGFSYLEMSNRWIGRDGKPDELQVAEKVIAIGSPLKTDYEFTTTIGYISSRQKRVAFSENRFYEDLIQHSAQLKKGNSGGPLIDASGKVIGLNTLADGTLSGSHLEDAIYMSVPIYPVMLIMDKVVYNYEHGIKKQVMYDLPATYIDKTYNHFSNTYNYQGEHVQVVEGNEYFQAGDEICKISFDGKDYSISSRNDLYYAILKTMSENKDRSNITAAVYVKRGSSSQSLEKINVKLV